MARVQAAALCCLPQANRHWRARPLHLGPVLCCRAYHLSTASAGQPCRHLPSLAIPEGTPIMAMDTAAPKNGQEDLSAINERRSETGRHNAGGGHRG